MTGDAELLFTWDLPAAGTGRFVLSGDLVNEHAERLLAAVNEKLAEHRDLREVWLDCAKLELCDSRGLSVLLMVRRRTDSLGITLRLVNPTRLLDRLLDRTGTADYLTGPH